MADDTPPLRLTRDEIGSVLGALDHMRQGFDHLSKTDDANHARAAIMAKDFKRLQDKIISQTQPDMADHVAEFASKSKAAERAKELADQACICQQGFKSTGSGRQEVRILNPRCPTHGKPKPTHLRAV